MASTRVVINSNTRSATLDVTDIRHQIVSNIDPTTLPNPSQPGGTAAINIDLGAWNFRWQIRGHVASLSAASTLLATIIGTSSLFSADGQVYLLLGDSADPTWDPKGEGGEPVIFGGFKMKSIAEKGGGITAWTWDLQLVSGASAFQ